VRVAAIDCGTNSLRLLVADVDVGARTVTDLVREMEIVRLGEGVDKTRRFSDAALERTLATCRRFAGLIESLDVERIRFVATSASRDATNRDDFFGGVHDALGVDVEVVSGDEEAALSFAGATQELVATEGVAPPYLVVDIGGGSTEFVLGSAKVDAARSVDVGCVRLAERHLRSDPATAEEIGAARADVERAIDEVEKAVPLGAANTLVGLAGSVTTIAALALELPAYDPVRIHHSRIAAPSVHEIARRLLAMSCAERKALSVMHPGRADVIGAGALILDTVVSRVGAAEVVVSEHDILDGIALSLTG
jgi:exopolyphosphatase / guanosine-5'-triphosphate,3'-diphosphate pyrophosphatase